MPFLSSSLFFFFFLFFSDFRIENDASIARLAEVALAYAKAGQCWHFCNDLKSTPGFLLYKGTLTLGMI